LLRDESADAQIETPTVLRSGHLPLSASDFQIPSSAASRSFGPRVHHQALLGTIP